MKTTFAALSALALGTSMVMGAVHPNPTAAVHHHRRQQFPQGVDVTAMLADPSSYLSAVSTALAAKDGDAQWYAQQWSSVANDPDFQASMSTALISKFGTKSAKVALAKVTNIGEQFEDCLDEVNGNSSDESTASADGAARVVNADVSGNTGSAQEQQQVSNAIVSGAAGLSSPSNMAALALAALPAVLLAVL